MAKVPQLRRFDSAGFIGSTPWFKTFLGLLEPFLTDVTNALTGKLSLVENIQSSVDTVQFATKADGSFAPFTITIKGFKPRVVVVAQLLNTRNVPTSCGSVGWVLVNEGIQIGALTGLAVSTKYKITILSLA